MGDVNLIGIVGSLRAGSVNAAAARAAADIVGDGVTMALVDVADVPLYHGDEEAAGPPGPVTELHAAVREADGIVLFSPEYNSSFPAVTKNVIDWLSREPAGWEGSGITMIVLSPGGRAGAGVREHFEAIMPRQASRSFPTLGLGNSAERIDDHGEVSDPTTLTELRDFLQRFADFCSRPVES